MLFLGKLAAFFGLAYQWLISGLSIASTSVFRLYVCLIPLDGCAPSSAVNSVVEVRGHDVSLKSAFQTRSDQTPKLGHHSCSTL